MRRPSDKARARTAATVAAALGRAVAVRAVLPRRALTAGAVGLISLALAGCSSGTPSQPLKSTLSVVTANMANAADVDGLTWKDRIDHFSAAISANGPAPDIISMTESAGLWHCWTPPFRSAEDYDLVDRLIYNLQASTGVRYRIAYMTGVEGEITNAAGTPHCQYYTGDTLLYNPVNLTNLNPGDVTGLPQVAHNSLALGFQTRRSLPLCVRGSNLEPLETLIDGPAQTDRCNPVKQTHSGPAWAQVDLNLDGNHTLVATLGRFSINGLPGSSFDLFTIHPQAGHPGDMDAEVLRHKDSINSFVRALTGPMYRTSVPYLPAVIVGDFNSLNNDPTWPDHTTQVAKQGVMAVNIGTAGLGLAPTRNLQLDSEVTLPNQDPCTGPASTGEFSDHCGILVRFSTTP